MFMWNETRGFPSTTVRWQQGKTQKSEKIGLARANTESWTHVPCKHSDKHLTDPATGPRQKNRSNKYLEKNSLELKFSVVKLHKIWQPRL